MSNALYIPVKESLEELRSELKRSTPMIQPRIKMLIAMKKQGNLGISKRELSSSIGVCGQSIHKWRTLYKSKGLLGLTSHGRLGFKPTSFTKSQHAKIEAKLNDPSNGLRGYKELQEWIIKEFNKEIKYNTLLKYAIKNFGSKVKVARKSHAKKDDKAVAAFKKTSVKSVSKSQK